MQENYSIYNGVDIAQPSSIGDYCILGLSYKNTTSVKSKRGARKNTVIGKGAFIRSHTVIYADNMIGDDFTTGHNVLIREKNIIGNKVSIGSGSIIEHHIKIGDNVRIHSGVFIPEFSILEAGCWIGPRVVFTNVLHPLCPKAKRCLKGPIIKKDAKIGANVTILPGVTIGKKSLVGAGSVVIDNVPDGVVVVGTPAKFLKRIDELDCPYNLIDKPYK